MSAGSGGKGLTVADAARLEVESGEKFARLPAELRAQVHALNAQNYRRALRVYLRRLWRNDVIYYSAQPVSNIVLCIGHLARAEAALAELRPGEAAGPPVEVMDYQDCYHRRAAMLAGMYAHGGRRAEAASLVLAMAGRSMLWKKGDTFKDGRKRLVGDFERTEREAGNGAKQAKGKGEGMKAGKKAEVKSKKSEVEGKKAIEDCGPRVGEVWTDTKTGDRYLAKDAVGVQGQCDICAFAAGQCPKIDGRPLYRICDDHDVYLEKIEGVAAALAELSSPVRTGDVAGVPDSSYKVESATLEALKAGGACLCDTHTDDLTVWQGNTRRHSIEGLNELTESVRASGILEPLLGRPVGGVWGETLESTVVEIVCGARRLAAARRAFLGYVPVFVRAMTDKEAAVAVASENMQREDLRPLECSEAVLPVLEACGGDAQEAAGLLGRPVRWVRRAASLAGLSAPWRVLAESDGLSFVFLAMMARLPAEMQEDFRDKYSARLCAGGGDVSMLSGMTSMALAELGACAWLKGDRGCGMCAKRSDLQADLFTDCGPSARCLDPVCREEKRRAYVSAAKVAAAKRAGIEVQAVAVTDWARSTDSRKKVRVDMVPVVVDKGPESGTMLWRDAPRRADPSGGGVDATPRGPTPEQRKQAAYVKATVAELSKAGRLEEWADDQMAGRATGAKKVLAAVVLFGIPADDAETAGRAEAVLNEINNLEDRVWAGRLIDGIRRKLAFERTSEVEGAHAFAELARRLFGVDKI